MTIVEFILKLIYHIIFNIIFQPEPLESKIDYCSHIPDYKVRVEILNDSLIMEEFMNSSLLDSIVFRESRNDTTVISSAYCLGKYQLHPMYFEELGIDWRTYIVDNRFTMPVILQDYVCRYFVLKHIAALKQIGIPPTIDNIFNCWYGIGIAKQMYYGNSKKVLK